MNIYKYTNTGNREVNQDYVLSQFWGQDISLHLIADGMGGYDCGEIASKIVGDTFFHGLSHGKTIEECTVLANDNILKETHNLGISKMGSTIAGVLINENNATCFWVGDSRAYVFRKGKILFQTEDHSMVNELNKVKPLTFEERKRYGHIITRSIMGKKEDRVDIKNLTLNKDDEILLCSDGIYNDYPIDYIIECIKAGTFETECQNQDFSDNHSLIYIHI